MPTPVPAGRFARFATFEVDLAAGELRKHGIKIKLQEQPFQILALLLEHAGEVVTREDLRERLWPSDTFVDFDNGLNAAISKLRQALRDTAENPRFVETLARRGYRFLAPVERPTPAPSPAVTSPEPAAASPRPAPLPQHGARRWMGAVVLVLLLVVLAALVFGPNPGGWRGRVFAKGTIRSLAVLPMQNLSGDPSQTDVVDGLTDALTADLSRIGALRVIPRNSTLAYRGAKKTIPEIGRELNADAVLEGSVARSGDRARVTAELIEASSGRQIWTESYERNLTDLFTLQREVSRSVSDAIRLKLTDPEKKRLAEKRAVNPEAYDLYLRGLYHAGRDNEGDIDQAIALFEKSAALEPSFEPIQAELAHVYGNKSFFFRPNDPQWEERGFAAVQKALALDPTAPEAHYAQGLMLWRPSHAFPSREALAEYRKALASKPNFDEAWHGHGVILFHVGHLEAGLHDIQRAVSVNPANTLARFRFGPILTYQLKYEEAIAALKAVPKQVLPSQWEYQLTWNLLNLGRLQEARNEIEGALKESPKDPGGVLHSARAMLLARSGDRKGAEADITQAIEIGKGFGHFHHTAYAIGAVYSVLGDLDKAQEWIENAAGDGFPNYTLFEADPNLERLRTTLRFRAFLTNLRRDWEHIPGETE